MDGFIPTRALGRAVLLVGLLLLAAVLLERVDLVVLAAPFAVGTGYALPRRARAAPTVRLTPGEPSHVEGGPLSFTVTVSNPDPLPYDLIVVRTAMSPYLRVRHGDRPYVASIRSGEEADIVLSGHSLRWGRQALGPAVAHPVVAGGLLLGPVVRVHGIRLSVYPAVPAFDAAEAMPRAAGLVGAHRSRRPGQGGELAGVRQFAPGDRLRRIDWRNSLRTGELHVAATLSDRDAEVVLLLDVLHEAGVSGGVFGAASVLDTTVRAAAGIAEHYLKRGDRVAMLEFSMRARRLRAASGRRQFLTVVEWLLDTEASAGTYEPSPAAFGAHLTSSNALVIVLSPLLAPGMAAALARLSRAGRFVLAVDTLPPGTPIPSRNQWTATAGRLWRLERDNTIDALRDHGVPVVPWAGSGSLDEVLRHVARSAIAPRAIPR